MDSVFKAFPFQLVFRGVFPGGFFVLSFLVASHGWNELQDEAGKLGANWLGIAIFVGVMVYVIHRSLLYPLIEFFFDWFDDWCNSGRSSPCCNKAKHWCRSRTLIRTDTISKLLDSWSTGTDNQPQNNIAKHLTAWNDYIHLQYASVWCICLGPIPSMFASKELSIDWPLIMILGILFVGGLVSERRYRAVRAVNRRSPQVSTNCTDVTSAAKTDKQVPNSEESGDNAS
jgi:hypothetical protein